MAHSKGRSLPIGRTFGDSTRGPFGRSPLSPWLYSPFVGFELAAASTFDDLDLTTPGDGSAASDISDTFTTQTLARVRDLIALGSALFGIRASITITDLESYYDGLAADLALALAPSTSDGLTIGASGQVYVTHPVFGFTVMSAGASAAGDYTVHKDAGGISSVVKNSYAQNFTWQGGTTSGSAAAAAGAHALEIYCTHTGIGTAAGKALLDGIDQGTAFVNWAKITGATVPVHVKRVLTVACNTGFTFTMKCPLSVGRFVFQRNG